MSGQTTVPTTSTQSTAMPESALAVRWLFPVTNGPLLFLGAARIVLGRAEDCGCPLPGTETSRHHAEILREGQISIVRDLDSTNGVFVNGRRVAYAPLQPGDVLRLGEWVGAVVRAPATPEEGEPFRSMADGLHAGPVLAAALDKARRAAASELPIVIEGATGTGKERVARAIHAWSGRAGPFLGVNCAALPEHLAEGELFGYRKGAFTGAERAHPGQFRAAQGGTLLLDELTDLSLALQAKLLRVLDQRQIVPLGEAHPIAIDVRVVAATQVPLEEAVAAGRFRADLYARLNGLSVRLPRLRERIEDVPHLFAKFLHERTGGRPPALEAKLVEQLCLYDWPLNVRELDLLTQQILVLHGHEKRLVRAHLPEHVANAVRGGAREEAGGAPAPNPAPAAENAAEEQDAELALNQLIAALRRHEGNVSNAAVALGMSRQRAYRLMERRPDLDLESFRRKGARKR